MFPFGCYQLRGKLKTPRTGYKNLIGNNKGNVLNSLNSFHCASIAIYLDTLCHSDKLQCCCCHHHQQS